MKVEYIGKDGWTEMKDIKFLKYRKKPIVIEARRMSIKFKVETLEGTMEGQQGDWLIKGINGELYPCKNDIFEKTYEKE